MNALRLPTASRALCWVFFACLAIVCLATAANSIQASEPSPSHAVSTVCAVQEPVPVLAAFWNNIMGNRSRMIQVGLVVVCLGFFLLSWSRK